MICFFCDYFLEKKSNDGSNAPFICEKTNQPYEKWMKKNHSLYFVQCDKILMDKKDWVFCLMQNSSFQISFDHVNPKSFLLSSPNFTILLWPFSQPGF